MKINHKNFINLAFENAKINLGKTNLNPSVGCVVVKDNTVLSSGYTSLKGRPHAENNALMNQKANLNHSDLYVTMEPCTHYGVTPPCTDLIIKKKIKRVFYSFDDWDPRTRKKARVKLKKRKIKVVKSFNDKFKKFYQSYFSVKNYFLPLIDAKLALSKDFYTINKKSKWITNDLSRKRAHLIRSEYDAIISTSKSINNDDSLLNCRLNGFNKLKPDLIILDRNLKLRKNLSIFKNLKKRKVYLFTCVQDNKKLSFFRKKNVKIIFLENSLTSKKNFISLFKLLKKFEYSRILVESGLIFLNELLKFNLISNIYIFQSPFKLKKEGKNNTNVKTIKKLRLKNKIKVNLKNDKLYKIHIK